KTARAAAIMRVGNLLHFGFETSPERMTEDAKSLLVNSICYISRFTEDRPIVRIPCVFMGDKRYIGREVLGRNIADQNAKLDAIEFFVSKSLIDLLAGKSKKEQAEWYRQHRDFLHGDAKGSIAVDDEAKKFGVAPHTKEFLKSAIEAMGDSAKAPLARGL